MMDWTKLSLTFEAMPSSIPAVVRYRRLLKLALRALDLRCVAINSSPSSDRRGGGFEASGRGRRKPASMPDYGTDINSSNAASSAPARLGAGCRPDAALTERGRYGE